MKNGRYELFPGVLLPLCVLWLREVEAGYGGKLWALDLKERVTYLYSQTLDQMWSIQRYFKVKLQYICVNNCFVLLDRSATTFFSFLTEQSNSIKIMNDPKVEQKKVEQKMQNFHFGALIF